MRESFNDFIKKSPYNKLPKEEQLRNYFYQYSDTLFELSRSNGIIPIPGSSSTAVGSSGGGRRIIVREEPNVVNSVPLHAIPLLSPLENTLVDGWNNIPRNFIMTGETLTTSPLLSGTKDALGNEIPSIYFEPYIYHLNNDERTYGENYITVNTSTRISPNIGFSLSVFLMLPDHYALKTYPIISIMNADYEMAIKIRYIRETNDKFVYFNIGTLSPTPTHSFDYSAYADDQFHHFVFTFDTLNDTFSMYIDKNLELENVSCNSFDISNGFSWFNEWPQDISLSEGLGAFPMIFNIKLNQANVDYLYDNLFPYITPQIGDITPYIDTPMNVVNSVPLDAIPLSNPLDNSLASGWLNTKYNIYNYFTTSGKLRLTNTISLSGDFEIRWTGRFDYVNLTSPHGFFGSSADSRLIYQHLNIRYRLVINGVSYYANAPREILDGEFILKRVSGVITLTDPNTNVLNFGTTNNAFTINAIMGDRSDIGVGSSQPGYLDSIDIYDNGTLIYSASATGGYQDEVGSPPNPTEWYDPELIALELDTETEDIRGNTLPDLYYEDYIYFVGEQTFNEYYIRVDTSTIDMNIGFSFSLFVIPEEYAIFPIISESSDLGYNLAVYLKADNNLELRIGSLDNTYTYDYSNYLDSEFHHIVYVFDTVNKNYSLFVDKSLEVNEQTYTGTFSVSNLAWFQDWAEQIPAQLGLASFPMVFDTKLLQSEINYLYDNLNPYLASPDVTPYY